MTRDSVVAVLQRRRRHSSLRATGKAALLSVAVVIVVLSGCHSRRTAWMVKPSVGDQAVIRLTLEKPSGSAIMRAEREHRRLPQYRIWEKTIVIRCVRSEGARRFFEVYYQGRDRSWFRAATLTKAYMVTVDYGNASIEDRTRVVDVKGRIVKRGGAVDGFRVPFDYMPQLADDEFPKPGGPPQKIKADDSITVRIVRECPEWKEVAVTDSKDSTLFEHQYWHPGEWLWRRAVHDDETAKYIAERE
jgi:hypothetical protein